MNTKFFSTVICVALMSAMSVSTVHAMHKGSKGQQPTPSVFEPFRNACKRFAVNMASEVVSTFMFINVGLYVTQGVHLFSRSNPHLLPISCGILAHGVITGFLNAYTHHGWNYTKKDMQVDVVGRSVCSLYSASSCVVLVNLFYSFYRLAPSHFR